MPGYDVYKASTLIVKFMTLAGTGVKVLGRGNIAI